MIQSWVMDYSWYNKIDSLCHLWLRFFSFQNLGQCLRLRSWKRLNWRFWSADWHSRNLLRILEAKFQYRTGKKVTTEPGKWRWCVILRLMEDLKKLGLWVVWASLSLRVFMRPGRAKTLEDEGKNSQDAAWWQFPASGKEGPEPFLGLQLAHHSIYSKDK